MYQSLSTQDYKRFLSVDENYIVDSLLVYGGWDRDKYTSLFLELLKEKKIKYALEEMPKGFLANITSVVINGKRLRFDVAYGGALLSEVAHVSCLFGCKNSILLGSCGGLKTGTKAETLIIPSFSYANESSARTYHPYNEDHIYKPNEALSLELCKKFEKEGIDVLREPITTCQAMLGETWEHIQTRSKEGYGGVEMESGVLFAVCNYFNVSSSAILRVADNLIEQETVMSEGYEKRGQERITITKIMFEVAIDALSGVGEVE